MPPPQVANNLLLTHLQHEVQNAHDGLQQNIQHVECFTCDPLILPQPTVIRFQTVFNVNLRIL